VVSPPSRKSKRQKPECRKSGLAQPAKKLSGVAQINWFPFQYRCHA
jgi:hypothetical protein